jgi:TolA-binding protein
MKHEVFTWLPVLFSCTALAVAIASILFFRFRSASTALIAKLRGEISDAQADIADLRDRFTRFQKREGMRAARQEKETAASLKEQAMAILAQGAPGAAGNVPSGDPAAVKAELRRRFFNS